MKEMSVTWTYEIWNE